MNEPINHHYLPVFYLRQWCNADGKIVRYYRPHRDVVASPITPENTGYEPHLYALNGYPDEQKQWIEKHYMGPVVDEPASRALRVLLARSEPTLSVDTRIDWTRFLMALALRDPTTVAKTSADARNELATKLLANPEEYEAIKGPNHPPTFYEWVEANIPSLLDNFGKLMLPNLIESQDIGTIMIRMRWSTLDLSSSGISLLTGDRPFIRVYGLKDKRCVIALPMSPRFAFIATHAPEAERGLLKAGVKRLANDVNAQIVAQAIKHVYGTDASHLRFVENRLAPVGHVPFSG